MSNKYDNDFYEKDTKYSEDKIIENCKKFLSHRILKLAPKNKKTRTVFKKNKSLSAINLTSIYYSKSNKTTTDKQPFYLHKRKNNSALISNYRDNFNKNQINLRKINSSKESEKNKHKNINNYMTQTKVNEIIKSLLNENKIKHFSRSIPKKQIISLKKCINKSKYIDSIMRKEPTNGKLIKSYKTQIKIFGDKNRRKRLIEGIIDYHVNLKHYDEIFFDSFYCSDKNKQPNKKEINRSLNNINKEIKSSFIKNSYQRVKEFNKFKNDYIKAYKEWKFDYNKNNDNNKYIKKSSYFKYLSENNFNSIMPIDDKMTFLNKSIKSNLNYMKKYSFANFKKQYLS